MVPVRRCVRSALARLPKSLEASANNATPVVIQGKRPVSYFRELSDDERSASLNAMVAGLAETDSVWVFAYGSLMWRPGFTYAERSKATLAGYRRRFSVWTVLARGTPAAPGLALALEEGDGVCHGVAYRLGPGERKAGLETLWLREMLTSVYRPRWVEVSVGRLATPAIVFVVNKTDEQYAGDLPKAEQASLIAAAHGRLGSCRDYLADTVAELSPHGIEEPELAMLLREVDAIRARGDSESSPGG